VVLPDGVDDIDERDQDDQLCHPDYVVEQYEYYRKKVGSSSSSRRRRRKRRRRRLELRTGGCVQR